MSRSVFVTIGACASFVLLAVACSSSNSDDPSSSSSSSGGSSGASSGGSTGGSRGASPSGDGGNAGSSSGGDAGAPAVQYIGRFDFSNVAMPKAGFPGSRAVARFDGTAAQVTISQQNGSEGGPSWFNVVVDGVVGTPFSVTGASEVKDIASGLAAGVHVVEVEKRNEGNTGAIVFENWAFPAGGQLLAPPARPNRRIEFLSDSTIDGFGVEGSEPETCGGGAPVQFNNPRKSFSHLVTAGVAAEYFLLGIAGKGVAKNEDNGDMVYFPALYPRNLPEVAGNWDFSKWIADAVVISLGGTDFGGTQAEPAAFQANYGGLVDTIRTKYPTAHIYMLIWSQIKDLGGGVNTRTALKSALDNIKAARAGDAKLHVFQLTEAIYPTDETGCYEHANVAGHQKTATQFVTQLKADTGW